MHTKVPTPSTTTIVVPVSLSSEAEMGSEELLVVRQVHHATLKEEYAGSAYDPFREVSTGCISDRSPKSLQKYLW